MSSRFLLTIMLAFLLFPLQAGAKTTPHEQTFSVLPFTLHGPQNWRYLQEAIPEMLSVRLTWPKHFTPVARAPKPTPLAAGASAATASQLRKKLRADYLIWGALSIIGNKCSLDIQTLGPKGEKKPFSSTCEVNNLIPHLEKVSDQISSAVFSRKVAPASQSTPAASKQDAVPLNNAFVSGQTSTAPLGPDMEASQNKSYWRTQALKFPARGMLIGDADGNGQKEIFLLKERGVAVYRLRENRLLPVDEFSTGLSQECLNINFLPASDGTQKIVVSATRHDSPSSFILSFTNEKLMLSQERIPYFLNVIKEPPLYQPVLFGQKKAISRFLDTKGIVELLPSGDKLLPGRTLDLPEHGNIFNIVFLPQKDGYKLIVADKRDKLRVFDSRYELLATTKETYAASATAIEYDTTFAGGRQHDSDSIKNYFLPTRLTALHSGGSKHQLLVARNISDVGQFFHRYRNFSDTEIHCLAWDGIGLHTVWKTRPLEASSVDYTITELNGQKNLLVCLVIQPGGPVTRNQKTMLVGCPLPSR